MPKIRYIRKNFSPKTLDIIAKADQICQHYAKMGYDLTLRQLYYQFVANGWLDNKQSEYNRLGKIVDNARKAGMIDWDHIVDRTRNLRGLAHWNDAAEIIRDSSVGFRIDKWADQEYRIEVWIEKDALLGVLQTACNPEDVPFFSCRGYTSQSEVWGAAQRIRRHIEAGQKVVVLHLGDHDPSGVDMTRDIRDRLMFYIGNDLVLAGHDRNDVESVLSDAVQVKRIALSMKQVERLSPPPNPAKPKDARYVKYVQRYGRECWELDALPPDLLVRLIRRSIDTFRDDALWQAQMAIEEEQKALLRKASDNWDGVIDFLDQIPDEEVAE